MAQWLGCGLNAFKRERKEGRLLLVCGRCERGCDRLRDYQAQSHSNHRVIPTTTLPHQIVDQKKDTQSKKQ